MALPLHSPLQAGLPHLLHVDFALLHSGLLHLLNMPPPNAFDAPARHIAAQHNNAHVLFNFLTNMSFSFSL
jgi:hypothetical protein